MILVFAALMAHVLQRGLAYHQPQPEVPAWGGARWIGTDGSPPKLFLRRTWSIGSTPESAWLTLAATDNFEVHVNGTLVAREDLLGERPAATIDLSGVVRAGHNVVAVEVTRPSTRHATAAAMRLRWQEAGGRSHELVSDGRWRVETRYQSGQGSRHDWTALDFDDSLWHWATEHEAAAGGEPQDDVLPQSLLQPSPRLQRFWHGDASSSVGAFELPLDLDAPSIEAAWIGVSVAGTYTLAVNDQVLGTTGGAINRVDAYDIAAYLQPGPNRISLQVADVQAPAQVATGGRVVFGPDHVLEIADLSGWRTNPHATPVQALPPPLGQRPTWAPARVDVPARWERARWMQGLALTLVIWLAAAGLVHAALGRGDAAAQDWLRAAQPFAAAAGVLLAALLVDLDPRWNLGPFYRFALPATALALAATLLLLGRRPGARRETP